MNVPGCKQSPAKVDAASRRSLSPCRDHQDPDLRPERSALCDSANIMRTKKKQLDVLKPSDLGVDIKQAHLKILKVRAAQRSVAGIKVP